MVGSVVPRHRRPATASGSAVTAGFVSVLVGVTSSVAIVFEAARAAGATPQMLGSWILALGVGMGVAAIVLSLRYRAPIVIAWSTPGAALLAASLQGVSMAVAVGAFLSSALLITLCGVTGWFEKMMSRVPVSLASALLAGVLLQFGLGLFRTIRVQAEIAVPMIVVYLLCRRWLPRYAILVSLVVGAAIAAVGGDLPLTDLRVELARPVFVWPEFTWQAFVGIAVPLFVVTMCSQNIPGTAALRAAGYDPPISPIITVTGATTLVLAPFGGFALNLAAVTAAICMGEEAHEDPRRRYLASVSGGALYIVVGVFGATLTALLVAFPATLVLAIAGLGLLGTIGNAILTMIQDVERREAATVTFLFAASGVTLLGIGSPFWALIAGVATMLVLGRTRAAAAKPPAAPAQPEPARPAPARPAPAGGPGEPAARAGSAHAAHGSVDQAYRHPLVPTEKR